MDFGVVKIAEKDFFQIMSQPGRPWEDRLDLYANNLSEYQHKSQFEPLDIKHVIDVPQQEGISNNSIFDVSDIDIDSTYHRQRYATLIWHYAKSKNEECAIRNNEVTGTVASKYGGPRTPKEQVMDTTIYPTPKSRNRN
ncbi:hypothetical protein EJD97_021639 [Solanum chilense]|uniref:Uncharacterized protein n=1 Tax=Solanum chilense TaxID=4083 RepID=A0A6N2AXB5_SOLCI|nr:hypothetical protein EJD97_021639 [Solanum chilense]